jgi:hypothetical protein
MLSAAEFLKKFNETRANDKDSSSSDSELDESKENPTGKKPGS